jgi:hypothetical protein
MAFRALARAVKVCLSCRASGSASMPISYAPLSQGELYVARPFPVGGGQRRVIIAALLIAALYAGLDLFVPLALAGLLEFVLAPLVRRLTIWGLPKGLSVALVIVLVLANWQFQTADARVKLKRLYPQFG